MIDKNKLLANPNSSANTPITGNFFLRANRKLVSIHSFLKGSLAQKKARKLKERRDSEKKDRERNETRLEQQKTGKKGGKMSVPSMKGPGIIGWFKNFIGKTLLGFFAIKLLNVLPALTKILPALNATANFLASTGMFLVDSIATFIDIGYSAIDSTKGLLRNIGGENLEMLFDKFTSAIGTVIDVLIIASLVRNVGGLRGARAAGGRGPFGFSIDLPGKTKAKPKRDRVKESLSSGGAGGIGGFEAGRELERERLKNLQEKYNIRDQKILEAREARSKRQKDIITRSPLGRKRTEIEARRAFTRQAVAAQEKVYLAQGYSRMEANKAARKFVKSTFPAGMGVADETTSLLQRRRAAEIAKRKRLLSKSAVIPTTFDQELLRALGLDDVDLPPVQGPDPAPPDDPQFKAMEKAKRDRDFFERTGQDLDPKAREAARAQVRADMLKDDLFKKAFGKPISQATSGERELFMEMMKSPKKGRVFARGAKRSFRRAAIKGLGAKNFKGLLNFISPYTKRIALIGPLLDFGINLLLGESIGRAAGKAVFAGLLGAVGTGLGLLAAPLLGPFAPLGPIIGATIGGIGGDMLGGFLYDVVTNNIKLPSLFTLNPIKAIQDFLKPTPSIQEEFGGETDEQKAARDNRSFFEKLSDPTNVMGRIKKPPSQPQTPSVPPRSMPLGGKVNFGSLLDLVTSGEGGLNSVNRGNAGDTPGGAKSILGKNLTDMTVDEVYAQQYPYGAGLNAVGKYQIIPSTMREFITYLRSQGIDTSKRKFDASIQNMFGPYSITQKREKVGYFLKGDTSVSLDTAQLELAAEYASIGVPYDMKKGSYNGKYPLRDIKKGESLYSGVGSNYAPAAHTEQIRSMLRQLREQAPYEKAQAAPTFFINRTRLFALAAGEQTTPPVSTPPVASVNPYSTLYKG